MIAQFCVAYGVAGWAKTGQTYTDGSAFYWIVANDRWYRFEPWWLLSTFGTNALRWATWIAVLVPADRASCRRRTVARHPLAPEGMACSPMDLGPAVVRFYRHAVGLTEYWAVRSRHDVQRAGFVPG